MDRAPALAHTRRILLTAFDERGQGEQALQCGFAAYITKPVKQSQLLDVLVGTLGTQSAPAHAQRRQPPAQAPVTPRSKQQILLVDDHPVNQQIALRQLAALGYRADIAANGREAVDTVAAGSSYALILMDCQMPEMDGFAATRAIRLLEQASGQHTPIVAITANAMQGDREACIAAGMDDYLSKPVRGIDLQRVLVRWLPAEHNTDATQLDQVTLAHVRELQSADQPDVLGELIDMFVRDARGQISSIRAALAGGDVVGAANFAHRLRGSSLNLGATALAACCADLEAIARRPTRDGAAQLLRLVEQEFERAVRALEAERHR
jgi:CheY-like chemotaxis protein/HPt (histidine-containing phosphotransfer) domain-containing protein